MRFLLILTLALAICLCMYGFKVPIAQSSMRGAGSSVRQTALRATTILPPSGHHSGLNLQSYQLDKVSDMDTVDLLTDVSHFPSIFSSHSLISHCL
jgi:hypothetical protein